MNKQTNIVPFLAGLMLSVYFLPAIWCADAHANISGAQMATFSATPVNNVESVAPIVMLAMSMDHQYWFKAYNDYSDIDGDAVPERTYKDSFEYYGYFHSRRCYSYNGSLFEIVGVADGTNGHHCLGTLQNTWSGNFLNWATMTRMDVVRKILYGGKRSVDSVSDTVLERAHLPTDAHSFVKYYNGADLLDLMPDDATILTDAANNNNGIDGRLEGITICNTSPEPRNATVRSENSNADPMMRVVIGNFQLWGANERWQCTWRTEQADTLATTGAPEGNSNDPVQSGILARRNDAQTQHALKTPQGNRDHIVRVRVCDENAPGFSLDATENLENCTPYGNDHKPEGHLQRYGLDGRIDFGLMTGSYEKNHSGGVLRKNNGPMTDEVDTATGQFIATSGIIHSLNVVRVWGYRYKDGTYFHDPNPNVTANGNCPFQLTDPQEGQCKSWGNPLSEIYAEALNYLSGGNPTSVFSEGPGTVFKDGQLSSVAWSDPITQQNSCATVFSLAFNASVNSYDNDQTTISIQGGMLNGASQTNVVGTREGFNNRNFFVGSTTGNTNEPGYGQCTAKQVTDFGAITGICPEAPAVEGSYHIAGLAHNARKDGIESIPGETQKVNTFAIALAANVPTIDVPFGGSTNVRILPAYRLLKTQPVPPATVPAGTTDGSGSIVDFKIVQPHTPIGNNQYYAKYYVNWEDSAQGGDYDQDMWGTIEYYADLNANTIRVDTHAVAQSTGLAAQLFGFVISGTTQDGFHAYSGILGANFVDPVPGVPGCTECRASNSDPQPVATPPLPAPQDGVQSYTFRLASGAADVLEPPLYYAAKWGGFEDLDGDGQFNNPQSNAEWDVIDQQGNAAPNGDGVPDNYFFVTNPAALEQSLGKIFENVIERVSSGTAAAVVANDQQGTGAVFQAFYDPVKNDGANSVDWIGSLHALWIDSKGFLREDSDSGGTKGVLDDYQTDKVIELFFDQQAEKSKLRRFSSNQADVFDESGSVELELSELAPIWNAREKLSELSHATIGNQRTYTDTADNGRYIFTWFDADFDRVVDSSFAGSEIVDFVASEIDSTNFRWLDTNTEVDAERLVEWLRGKDDGLTEFRSRKVDYDEDGDTLMDNGQDEIMRLGDIIHSTPVSVAAPAEAYDLLSLDASYAAFREHYRHRRQVVYVGSNDGMVHAFNAGFYNAVNRRFELELSGETRHPLGTELWAYVPKNLLPHLQWLGRKDYTHVYYVDNTVRVFDARIFNPSSTHPGGWGTILVAGMRFGGGTDNTGISLDIDADGQADVKTKSAYVVMDITDPEQPPTLLAELSPPNLQLTTNFPMVVAMSCPQASLNSGCGPDKWYLVFGSGPTSTSTASYVSAGGQNADVFVFDLEQLDSINNGLVKTFTLNEPDVFIGDMIVSDFNLNMKAEVLYFGTVGGPTDPPANANPGSFYRMSLGEGADASAWNPPYEVVTNLDRPIVFRPALTLDEQGRPWVITATGRLLANSDKASDSTQAIFGLRDPTPFFSASGGPPSPSAEQSVDFSTLYDVTPVRVFQDGSVSTDGSTNGSMTFDQLTAQTVNKNGWRRHLRNGASTPAQRNTAGSVVVGGIVFNDAFTPSADLCEADGSSELYGGFFKTGTTIPEGVFGTRCTTTAASCANGVVEAIGSVDLGHGLSAGSSPFIGTQDRPENINLVSQTSTGETVNTEATTLGAIRDGEISWREHRSQ